MTTSSMDLPIDASSLAWPASGINPEAVRNTPEAASLIEAAQSGSQDAFRQLVEVHQEPIYAFCLRWLGNPEDAREACQDTFVRAWGALHRYRTRGRFSTWLYQIALNLCRDRHKSKAQRQRQATHSLEDCVRELTCARPCPGESASLSGDLEKLARGIRLLPDSLRAALLLCAVEGLSHQECSQILKCSSRAVEGRVYRARRELVDWWHREP